MRSHLLAAFALPLFLMPASAGAQNTPVFRVPLSEVAADTAVGPAWMWEQKVGECSTSCGTGTREITHVCQDATRFDFGTGTFGPAEAAAQCTSTIGSAPPNTSPTCTAYHGCGFDWVKPAEVVTVSSGRAGCGTVKREFNPHCRRSDGTILADADHAFCRNDRPDYDDVAGGVPDALGYSRTSTEVAACTTTDNGWVTGAWGSWSSSCSAAATRSRSVVCQRSVDGQIKADAECTAAKPAAVETSAQYGGCTYKLEMGQPTACVGGLQTRGITCRRELDYAAVPTSFCGYADNRTSETQTCTSYAWNAGTWSAWGMCNMANMTRIRTRAVTCEANGATAADSNCTEPKPATTETGACPTAACTPGSIWTWNGMNWDDFAMPNWNPPGGMNGPGPSGDLVETGAKRLAGMLSALPPDTVITGITVNWSVHPVSKKQMGTERCP